MKKGVKLKDIADRVGVSVVSVSKALSGKSGVSDSVRKKIIEVADELGYKQPSADKGLRPGLTGNVGVLVPRQFTGPGSYYWELYQQLVACLSERGYYAIMEILEEEAEIGLELPMVVTDKKVDGLISLGQTDERYAQMLKKNEEVPVVFLDHYNAGEGADSVITDSFYGGYILTEYLVEKGHSKIGFVGTTLATSSITDRYFGYRKGLKVHGLKLRNDWVVADRRKDASPEMEMITLPDEMPTAFVCNCDMVASMIIEKLKDEGYRVPEDVSVVGYDNYSPRTAGGIKLTTYDPDMKKMARVGTEIILSKINGLEHDRGTIVVTGKLIEGNSVKEIGRINNG